MIKKTHKQKHNRKLNTLWFKIYEKQWEEYCKQFDMVIDNGRVLFVKKNDNDQNAT